MTTSLTCPRCGSSNLPELAFCRNCGTRLATAERPPAPTEPTPTAGLVDALPMWLVSAILRFVGRKPTAPRRPRQPGDCPRCGVPNRSGVAFCQNCGSRLT